MVSATTSYSARRSEPFDRSLRQTIATGAGDLAKDLGAAMDLPSDERELVRRIAAKDQAAFRTLLAGHQLRVFRFLARRNGNDAMAEELTNEVFTEV